MANRLAAETSPYLLQHKDNPVDWYPWGPAAIEAARSSDRPIFLSIGYSACHWCHVMEHESFENETIATKLNEHFVSIKVDREERPDLDQIYMNAVQMLTGHGGWPMSVFLTPDLKPFFGGTYWPPEPGRGMPGFLQVLDAVLDAWENRRDQVLEGSQRLTSKLQEIGSATAEAGTVGPEIVDRAAAALEGRFDFTHGGFGPAPKFPHALDLQVLGRYWIGHRRDGVLQMIRLTLDKMASGGMYDHLGGGFARYSVDQRWLVPHFEKMLYDNSLLANAYLEGYQLTGEQRYADVVRETLDYVLREMTDDAGGFYSAEDADSEGEEGKFYVWTPAEIVEVLGQQRAETFCYCYDVSEQGNFEGNNILNLPKPIEQSAHILNLQPESLAEQLRGDRAALLAHRNKRVRPGRDEKILVAWNGLMIDALARAAGVLQEPRYLLAAEQAARFILQNLMRNGQRLLHSYCQNRTSGEAFLDDYAALANACVSLYEADFNPEWIEQATRLADQMLSLFHDEQAGGFFYTAHDHERLIARHKDLQDSSIPSGNALAATLLVRLHKLTGREQYGEAAESVFRAACGLLERAPTAAGQMLLAIDMYLGPTYEMALVSREDDPHVEQCLNDLRSHFLPNKVVAYRNLSAAAPQGNMLEKLLGGKDAVQGEPTLYVCHNFACEEPVEGTVNIAKKIAQLTNNES